MSRQRRRREAALIKNRNEYRTSERLYQRRRFNPDLTKPMRVKPPVRSLVRRVFADKRVIENKKSLLVNDYESGLLIKNKRELKLSPCRRAKNVRRHVYFKYLASSGGGPRPRTQRPKIRVHEVCK